MIGAYIAEVVLTAGTHSYFMHSMFYKWAAFCVILCHIILICIICKGC